MRLKYLRWGMVPLVAALVTAAEHFAVGHYPETVRQLRLVMLLLAIGGPDG